MNNPKLKAFTLMEMTIAMLISAISIGMAFYMFQYFQQLFLQQQKQRQERFSYSLFKHLMQQDIDRAVWLRMTTNGLVCIGERGDISYQFDPAYIIRNQNDDHRDTFLIRTVTYDTAPLLSNLPSPELTDHLSLRVRFENKEHQFDYHKTYAAQQLMQPELFSND